MKKKKVKNSFKKLDSKMFYGKKNNVKTKTIILQSTNEGVFV